MAPSGPRPWPGRGMPVRLSSEVDRLPSPGAAASPPRPIRALGRAVSAVARASPVRLSSEVGRGLSPPPRESTVRARSGVGGAGAGAGPGAGAGAGRVNAEGSGAGRCGDAGAAGVAREARRDHAGPLSAGSGTGKAGAGCGGVRGGVARGRPGLGRPRPGGRALLRLPLHAVEKRHPLFQPAWRWVSRQPAAAPSDLCPQATPHGFRIEFTGCNDRVKSRRPATLPASSPATCTRSQAARNGVVTEG